MRKPGSGRVPPFSRIVEVAHLPDVGEEVRIVADADERAAIAAENALVDLARLEATLLVERRGRDGARVTGTVAADLTQRCVVSLEAFQSTLNEPVDVRFAPPKEADPGRPSSPATPEDDPPDPLIDGRIDLGHLATEFFVLGLDPYPHKPGVAFEDRIDPATGSPFDVLRKLAERS
jgi:hypothetical protein